MDAHLYSAFVIATVVLVAIPGPTVLLVTSIALKRGLRAGLTAVAGSTSAAAIYITAKSAILGLSEVMRGELAPHGISVSAFCPGPVQSNIAHSGELRPDKYRKDSGYAKWEQQLSDRPVSPLWMPMDEVGERVLAGLQRDELFIFTHPEFRKGLEERCAKMLGSFPDEEINTERYEAIKWLTENAIYQK